MMENPARQQAITDDCIINDTGVNNKKGCLFFKDSLKK